MLGNTEPRIYTKERRELTSETSLGFMAIEYAKNILKLELYPWQEWALIHLLEIDGDLENEWSFRFRTVCILVSRQNGKTVLSKIIASFFLNILQVKNVFGTSLSVEKAEETWDAVIADQEAVPELKREIDRIVNKNGGKKIVLTGGRVYKTGAPNRRAGRGDSNDLVLIDELREHRNWETWSAAVNSTNAKPNSLVIAFSNAGDPDSIVLRQLRSQAIAEITKNDEEKRNFGGADISGLGLFEWSAEDGCNIKDEAQIAKANPALGYGLLTFRAILANAETMPDNAYRSECLCQTVESLLPEPFPKGSWQNLLDPTSKIAPQSDLFYGIDMSADRHSVSISVCGLRDDGNYHIECIAKRNGLDWAIEWFRVRALKAPMKLSYQGRGAPVTGLAEQICTLTGVIRIPIEGPDLTNGWTRFWDSIAAGEPVVEGEQERGGVKTYHLDQPVLNVPAKTMQLKNMGNGLSLPDRGKSPDDISPLFAAAMAFSAATKIEVAKEKKIYQSAYNEDYTIAFI